MPLDVNRAPGFKIHSHAGGIMCYHDEKAINSPRSFNTLCIFKRLYQVGE